MTGAVSPLSVATCCHNDGGMADWLRLAEWVIARRNQLGYETRADLADASGLSARTLGDIETGRRARYTPGTLARLENALRWATGSVNRILDGGEPKIRSTSEQRSDDEALARVMRSDLTDDQKRSIVKVLIAEKAAAERRRLEHADELIQLLSGQ